MVTETSGVAITAGQSKTITGTLTIPADDPRPANPPGLTAPVTVHLVDKTALRNEITSAKTLRDSAVTGTQPGQYPEGAASELSSAIAVTEPSIAAS